MDANEQTVRTFAAFVFQRRADFHSGADPMDVPQMILAEARTIASTVTPVISKRAWYGIQHVLPDLTKECDGDPVVALFAWVAIQAVHASEQLEDGGDEDAVKRRLDSCVRDAISRLY